LLEKPGLEHRDIRFGGKGADIRFAQIARLWQSYRRIYKRKNKKRWAETDLKKRRIQQFERRNSDQLDVDVVISAHIAGWIAAFMSAGVIFLIALSSDQPLTIALSYQVALAGLMLLAILFLACLSINYSRYRTVRTFLEYLRSLKQPPLSHWTIPIKTDLTDPAVVAIRCRQILLFSRRCCPQFSSKQKAPLLLFRQAPLLLAP